MIKAVVVSSNLSQYATYIRNKRLNREEYAYYRAGHEDDCFGLDGDVVKVLWLDGWSENEKMTTSDVKYLKEKFSQHQTVSEGWIYSEGFVF